MTTMPITLPESALDALDWTEVRSTQMDRLIHLPADHASALGIVRGDSLHADTTPMDVLLVQFRSKGAPSVYAYWGANETVMQNIVDAESPGKMLNLAVKGVYQYTKLVIEDT